MDYYTVPGPRKGQVIEIPKKVAHILGVAFVVILGLAILFG